MRLRSQTPSYYSFGEKRDDQSNLWNLVQSQLVFQHSQEAVKMTWCWLWKGSVLFTEGPGGLAPQLQVGQQRRPSVLGRDPWEGSRGQRAETHAVFFWGGYYILPSEITQTIYSEKDLNQRIKKSKTGNPTHQGLSTPGFIHISARGSVTPALMSLQKVENAHQEPVARMHETTYKLQNYCYFKKQIPFKLNSMCSVSSL